MTYSVLAFDSANRQFGVAVASCVPLDVVKMVPGEVAGRGAYVTQSVLFEDAHVLAGDRLAQGASAEDTLAAMIAPAFDPSFSDRQYAVVDIDGGIATFTGETAGFFAGHRENRFASFVYSVQGNLLADDSTLDNAEAGFLADVCDLPERLVTALERAGFDRGGDRRCTPFGHPAQAALVHVPSVGLSIEVDVGNDRLDPALALRERFDVWRKDHPCPTGGGIANTPQDDGCHVGSSTSWDGLVVVPLLVFLVFRTICSRRCAPR